MMGAVSRKAAHSSRLTTERAGILRSHLCIDSHHFRLPSHRSRRPQLEGRALRLARPSLGAESLRRLMDRALLAAEQIRPLWYAISLIVIDIGANQGEDLHCQWRSSSRPSASDEHDDGSDRVQ
jgi:hypothetical protein